MFVSVRLGRVWLACWGICLLATISGCSCSGGADAAQRKKVFPVSGELYFNDAPAKHVMVILQPVNEAVRAEVWPLGFPKATVAANGSFEIGTYEVQDGAPEGEYLILVIPTDAALGEMQGPVGDAPRPKAVVQGPGSRFSSPDHPAGRYIVEPKENKIPRLSLTGA